MKTSPYQVKSNGYSFVGNAKVNQAQSEQRIAKRFKLVFVSCVATFVITSVFLSLVCNLNVGTANIIGIFAAIAAFIVVMLMKDSVVDKINIPNGAQKDDLEEMHTTAQIDRYDPYYDPSHPLYYSVHDRLFK